MCTACLCCCVADTVAGGAVITVFGTNFLSLPSLRCRFGGYIDPTAAYLDANRVTCTVPPLWHALPDDVTAPWQQFTVDGRTTVNVSVSNSGQFLSLSAQPSVTFSYGAVPTIASITPNVMGVSGGLTVTVTGSGFAQLGTLSCQFSLWDTLALAPAVIPVITVAAVRVSSSQLTCLAPSLVTLSSAPYVAGASALSFPVKVMVLNLVTPVAAVPESTATLVYIQSPTVTSISRGVLTKAAALQGSSGGVNNLLITVTGTRFSPAAVCRVSTASAALTFTDFPLSSVAAIALPPVEYPATYVSATSVLCNISASTAALPGMILSPWAEVSISNAPLTGVYVTAAGTAAQVQLKAPAVISAFAPAYISRALLAQSSLTAVVFTIDGSDLATVAGVTPSCVLVPYVGLPPVATPAVSTRYATPATSVTGTRITCSMPLSLSLVIQANQANTLRVATHGGHAIYRHTNQFAAVGDDHQIVFVGHDAQRNNLAVAFAGLDGDHAFAAATLGRVIGGWRALTVTAFAHGEQSCRHIALNDRHACLLYTSDAADE